MAGILKGDVSLSGSCDRSAILQNYGRAAVRVLATFKEEDRFPKVAAQLIQRYGGKLREEDVQGEHLAADKAEVVRKRIFRGRRNVRQNSSHVRKLYCS